MMKIMAFLRNRCIVMAGAHPQVRRRPQAAFARYYLAGTGNTGW